MKVALATCAKLPEPDVDEAPLMSSLEVAGAKVRLLAWDDADSRPDTDELVVIRSTWNYYEHVEAFLGWVERTGRATRLLNPAPIVQANAKKTYLREVERRGIDVVPTEFLERGVAASIEGITRARGWDAIVIKPVVSAGSFLTQRFEAKQSTEAQRFLEELTAKRDAMVQRWMPSVDTYGERSLVWIDGELSHAIRKSARFIGGSESVSAEVPISPEERAFAERVLSPIAKELLYARVDVVRDEDGTVRLMELELIEPSLFLKQCPRALDRLTHAIVRRARGDLA
jgi:hypothetical protein